ncbi:MAG: hypothetical protein HC880_16505, partial [Bacteroidia bacterium]|nr:hypothetical protein [Bacteroidia bacterium]
IIERVKENNILVHIDFFYDYWVIGYVIDMDEEFIVVEVVSEEGDDDGFSCFRVEEIESITGRTNKLRKVEFYYENRRKFYSNN